MTFKKVTVQISDFCANNEGGRIIAIYHFNVKVVSRGKGASAVAKAAYISGEKIKNEYDGVTHDYRKKGEVIHKEILLPDNAPPKYQNRAILWNAVEMAETRKNSQTAKHIDAALPVEISREEQIDLVRKFCKQCFVSRGMYVDFAIHDKGEGNPHVHILINTRRVDENGFTKKERAWNDKSLLLEWRKLWADWCNHKLYFVSGERIDHRSYKEQRINKIPQKHLGAAACAIERKGFKTDKGSHNRKVILANAEKELADLDNEYRARQEERHELMQEYFETKIGCPYSEMLCLKSTPDYTEAFENELIQAGIPCGRASSKNGTSVIYFAPSDESKINEMITLFQRAYESVYDNGKEATWNEMIEEYKRCQRIAEKGNEQQVVSEQKQDMPEKPIKRRQSR